VLGSATEPARSIGVGAAPVYLQGDWSDADLHASLAAAA
jgi:hypothetical protein